MKYIFYLCLVLKILGCNTKPSQIQDPNKLILRIKCMPEHLAIGYANIVGANVLQVLEGQLEDTTISITILPNDTAAIYLFFTAAQSNGEIVDIELKKYRDNEKHRHTFINGFVGSNHKSWQIVNYEKAKSQNK